MGTRSPERIPAVEWRRQAETVGEMVERRWEVRTHCETCGLYIRTSLAMVVAAKGAQISLWNGRQRCRRLLHSGSTPCNGYVYFEARPPQRVSWLMLRSEWPPGKEPRALPK